MEGQMEGDTSKLILLLLFLSNYNMNKKQQKLITLMHIIGVQETPFLFFKEMLQR